MFCFFKQKTAYEMRISDWSSDVCASDQPSQSAGLRRRSAREPHQQRRQNMITKYKRLLGTFAGAMALAAVTGFGVARCTADPAPAPAAEGGAEAASEALPNNLVISPEAIKSADIGVETIASGGLRSEEHTS